MHARPRLVVIFVLGTTEDSDKADSCGLQLMFRLMRCPGSDPVLGAMHRWSSNGKICALQDKSTHHHLVESLWPRC